MSRLKRHYLEANTSFKPPSHLSNLGLGTADLLHPFAIHHAMHFAHQNMYPRHCASANKDSSLVHSDDKFVVTVDVHNFKFEEVVVKVVNRFIVVECKHWQKEGQQDYVSRQLTRRFVLPKEYETSGLSSNLMSNGTLTITATKPARADINEKIIPIVCTETAKPNMSVGENSDE